MKIVKVKIVGKEYWQIWAGKELVGMFSSLQECNEYLDSISA